jgi:hypothetical protein
MRIACVALATVVGACGFRAASVTASGDDGGADVIVPIDADLGDAPAICSTWQPHDLMPCNLGSPQPDLTLDAAHSPYTYNTDTAGGELRDNANALVLSSPITIMQSDGSFVAVLSIAKLTIPMNVVLNITGAKPLIIASWSTIEIDGTVDAGSHSTDAGGTQHEQSTTWFGPGANPASCDTATGGQGLGATADGGSGGGAGGAFQGGGGKGGDGDTGCNGDPICPRPGGSAGIAVTSVPIVERGGCAGGPSGTAGAGAPPNEPATWVSPGGGGGGALELDARMMLHIAANGQILAGGAGGAGCAYHTAAGGGGGGAGGYLGFDAPMISIDGTVAANGGGGGGSAPFTNGTGLGYIGSDGLASGARAPGGMHADGGSCGQPGTAGSGSGALAGVDDIATADGCGGGGAGGGAGYVLYWSAMFMAKAGSVVSPAALAGPT